MPLGDLVPTIPVGLPGRRMDGKGWETWLNPNQQPTIPMGPNVFGTGGLGGRVAPGPYESWENMVKPAGSGGGGTGLLTAPANPVASLNQIIADATQPKTITKGLGVESLLQNQVLGRILNSYYGDQAWKDLENPYADVAASPDFKTFEGGGGAYGYIDPMFGRLLPSLSGGGGKQGAAPASTGSGKGGKRELWYDVDGNGVILPYTGKPPESGYHAEIPYPAPPGWEWQRGLAGWYLAPLEQPNQPNTDGGVQY